MASSREERFQQRVRGAGARPLQNFGFDFSVPDTQTPSQPGSSPRKRKTPQPASASATQPASRRTRRSTGSDAAEGSGQAEASLAPNKRRRLSSKSPAHVEEEDVSVNAEPLADITEEESELVPAPDTRESDEPAQAEVSQQSVTFLETPQSVRKRRVIQYSSSGRSGSRGRRSPSVQPLGVTPHRKNVGQIKPTPQTSSSVKKRKKRKSVGQKAKGSSKRRSLLAGPVSPGAALSIASQDDALAAQSAAADHEQASMSEEDAPAPPPPPQQKKPLKRRLLNAIQRLTGRKSSTPVAPEPTSSAKRKRGRPRKGSPKSFADDGEPEDTDTPDIDQPLSERQDRRRAARSFAIAENAGPGSDGEADETAPMQANTARRKRSPVVVVEEAEDEAAESVDEIAPTPRSGRPRKSLARGFEDGQEEDEARTDAETEVAPIVKKRGRPRKSDVHPAAPSPKRRKQERQQRDPSSVAEPSSSTGATRATETTAEAPKAISVGVYRISGAEHLNLDTDGGGDENDLTAIPKRSGVNAVDVLSQICGEQIEKQVMRLRTHAKGEKDKKKKRELQDARQLISQFGNDLETRLLQMATELDHNHSLTGQLRQVAKRQEAKRTELLSIRQQRRELAEQIASVRAEHEAAEETARREHDLHELVNDVMLAVQRGRAAERNASEEDLRPVGLDLRLREVTEKVSTADGRMGMLGRISSLNDALEKAIAA